MNRITHTFEELRRQGQKGLIGYLTAGDPDLKTSERHIRAALRNGLDLLEIGVPFSDPTADGPTIQAAGQRALRAGVTLRRILGMVKRLRRSFETPMILFSYANPLFVYGYEKLCADAASAGLDGVLVVDLPFEEAEELRRHLRRHGLMFIQLIAPTTSKERVARLVSQADGFVYYIMVKGVTGARAAVPEDVAAHLREVQTCTNLPIAVGFGISQPDQVQAFAPHADGIIVG